MDYKNSIRLGIELDSKGAQTKLDGIIKTLNENKINLDVKIKDSSTAKQLETLTVLANNFKKALGGNISLGNIDKTINKTVSAMENLNGEILKTTTLKFNNGTIGKELTETANGIGSVVKQIKSLKDGNLMDTSKTIVTNNAKIKQSLEDIAKAQERLNNLESNGVVNKNNVADLKNMFSNSNNFSTDNELKSYLNQVKELENEERRLQQIQSEGVSLYQQHENEKTRIAQTELQKRQQLEAKVDNTWQKLLHNQDQEQKMITQHQADFYKQLEVFKSNGILNKSDINNLEKMVQSATKLSQMHNLFGEFQMTTMKESSIASLSKQLEDAQIKLNKMKQSFGSKLSNNFINSIETEINKLKDSLKKVDGMNFNGLKNSLNQINTEMKVVTNETQRLVNSEKGGFFSGISNFLSKIGVFYGVQQVFQEISQQFRNASEYTQILDKNLTNIQMITGKTRQEVVEVTNQFKELGAQLHITNQEMLAGSEELLRAGYDNSTTEKMLEASSMASKISGQTTQATTEQLIAIKNSFNMTGDQMQHVIDVMSKLDNTSATSFAEISSAIMRTAFSAQQAGTSFDTLSTYVTTVSEKTRRSAETIGEAFKSIYSRYYNIKLGNVDEDGKTINDVETAMNRLGISIRSSKGEFKDFDVVLQEFVDKYQKGELSQVDYLTGINTLGGTRQKETLLALVENFDQVKKHQEDLTSSTGSAKKMYDVYADSIEAKVSDLKRAFENLYEKILSSDTLKWLITEATEFINALASIDASTIKIIGTFTALGLALKSIGTLSTALKGVETVANLGKDAGLIGNLVKGFGNLGTSIKGATTASLSFIATPLGATLTALTIATGVAVASYEEYQNIMSKPVLSTTTEDLSTFGKMVNSVTGDVIKSKQELIETNSAYEDFSNDLSDKFKDSVEDASKSFNKLKMSLQFDGEQKIFSDKMSQGIKDQIDDIVEKAKKSILEKKSDVQDTFSKLFTDDDGSIDINESGVLESISEYQNSKFETVQTLNQNIYDTLNKAVEEHRQLTEEDISNIKNWTQQIQALQIQANTGNKFDEEYSSNQGKFEKRLGSMTPEEALSEAKNTYNSIIDINQKSEDEGKKTISDANAFIEQWQSEYEKMPDKSSEKALALAKSLDLAREKITQAQNKLNNEVETRQEQTKKLWDAFYKTNPDKKGKINEINFTEFSGGDVKSNEEFKEVMQWYPQVAKVTETSMKRIQNANGTWSDVAVTIDEATGKIVSIYDTTTGTVAGYSKQFEDDAEKTYSNLYNAQAKVVALMNDTYSKTNGGSNFKLNGDNNFSIVDDKGVETTIEKMQQVIQLSGGYKVAVANINGTQIKMEFDKDGALQNYEDVLSAINGDKNSKAIVDFDINTEEGKKKLQEIEDKILLSLNGKEITTKITIDGQEADATTDDIIAKLNELKESNPNAKITINGEEIPTIDEAIKKLSEVPPNTNTDVIVNTSDANSKVEETSEKVELLDNQTATPTVSVNTGNSLSLLDRIKSGLSWLSGKVFSATVNVTRTEQDTFDENRTQLNADGSVGHNAKGTDNWRGGLTWINEEGGELVNLPDGTQIIPHDLSKKIIEENANKKATTEIITINMPDVQAKKVLKVPEDNDGGYFPTLQASSSSSDSTKKAESNSKKAESEAKKAEKFRKQIERLHSEIDIDPYYYENNALKDVENQLTAHKTLMESLEEGSAEYQQAQLKEIELYKKKQEAILELNTAQYAETDAIKEKLSQYSFYFDANGELINSETRLLELEKSINEQTGDSEEAKQKKQDDIAWLKDINDLVKKYGTLTRDTIPKTANEYSELANEIKKVNEEMKKANLETLSSFRDQLASYIMKDAQEEADNLKDKLSTAKEEKLKALEEQKQAEIDSYDTEIQSLQEELDALNDESEDNEKKLAKLKAEKSLWEKDSSVFSKSKIEQLNTQIDDLEKTIKKDDLQSQIDSLNEEKQLASDDYDEKINDLNDYYDEKEEALEKSNDKLLSEEEAYAKADKLIKEQSQEQILNLMSSYSESYKQIGSLLGENFKNGWIEQINQAKSAYDSLMGSLTGPSYSSNTFKDTTTSGTNYTVDKNGVFSDKPLTQEELDKIYSNTARYAEGGRTGNLGSEGKFVKADSNEMIANADDTLKFDEMYNYIKNSGSLISQLSQSYGSIGSYITPTLGADLNSITNGIVNNSNTNNTSSQSISMPVTIINQKGAEEVTYQTLSKFMNKWTKDQERRFK